jgi:hypothetical protein
LRAGDHTLRACAAATRGPRRDPGNRGRLRGLDRDQPAAIAMITHVARRARPGRGPGGHLRDRHRGELDARPEHALRGRGREGLLLGPRHGLHLPDHEPEPAIRRAWWPSPGACASARSRDPRRDAAQGVRDPRDPDLQLGQPPACRAAAPSRSRSSSPRRRPQEILSFANQLPTRRWRARGSISPRSST